MSHFGVKQSLQKVRFVCLSLTLLVLLAGQLSAGPTYSFTMITNNDPSNAAIGHAQLFAELSDPGAGQVLFTFTNTGPVASSITDIYFDDGSLFGIASIQNGTNVSFAPVATPPELPGHNLAVPPFVTTNGFSADSNPPTQPNGVNPGEWVGITFNLLPGMALSDVVNCLASGGLRIGLHVQAMGTNGLSEAFINDGTVPVVPVPGAFLLGGIGTLIVTSLQKRRMRP